MPRKDVQKTEFVCLMLITAGEFYQMLNAILSANAFWCIGWFILLLALYFQMKWFWVNIKAYWRPLSP